MSTVRTSTRLSKKSKVQYSQLDKGLSVSNEDQSPSPAQSSASDRKGTGRKNARSAGNTVKCNENEIFFWSCAVVSRVLLEKIDQNDITTLVDGIEGLQLQEHKHFILLQGQWLSLRKAHEQIFQLAEASGIMPAKLESDHLIPKLSTLNFFANTYSATKKSAPLSADTAKKKSAPPHKATKKADKTRDDVKKEAEESGNDTAEISTEGCTLEEIGVDSVKVKEELISEDDTSPEMDDSHEVSKSETDNFPEVEQMQLNSNESSDTPVLNTEKETIAKVDPQGKQKKRGGKSSNVQSKKKSSSEKDSYHECDLCSYVGSKFGLKRHIWYHHKGRAKLWCCPVCKERFRTKTQVYEHMKIHSESEEFRPIQEQDLYVRNTKNYRCRMCSYECNSHQILRHHKNNTHLIYTCDPVFACPRKFFQKQSVVKHIEENHLDGGKCTITFVRRCYKRKVSYECLSCDLMVDELEHMQAHVLEHDNSAEESLESTAPKTTYICDQCSKEFHSHNYLKCHQRRLHPRYVYVCGSCKGKSIFKTELVRHVLKCKTVRANNALAMNLDYLTVVTGKETEYKCTQCLLSFRDLTEVQQHVLVHDGKPRMCPLCDFVSSKKNYDEVVKHVREKHADHKNKSYLCQQCGDEFMGIATFKHHMASKHRPRQRDFKCHTCDKAFYKKTHLQDHLKTHDANRQAKYACETCGKLFVNEKYVKIHEKIHSGAKLECDECGKHFFTIGTLNRHKRDSHPTELQDKTMYTCQEPGCERQYHRQYLLIRHVRRSHRGKEPWPCDRCGYSFRTVTLYNTHPCLRIGDEPLQDTPEESIEADTAASVVANAEYAHITVEGESASNDGEDVKIDIVATDEASVELTEGGESNLYKCDLCGDLIDEWESVKEHFLQLHGVTLMSD